MKLKNTILLASSLGLLAFGNAWAGQRPEVYLPAAMSDGVVWLAEDARALDSVDPQARFPRLYLETVSETSRIVHGKATAEEGQQELARYGVLVTDHALIEDARRGRFGSVLKEKVSGADAAGVFIATELEEGALPPGANTAYAPEIEQYRRGFDTRIDGRYDMSLEPLVGGLADPMRTNHYVGYGNTILRGRARAWARDDVRAYFEQVAEGKASAAQVLPVSASALGEIRARIEQSRLPVYLFHGEHAAGSRLSYRAIQLARSAGTLLALPVIVPIFVPVEIVLCLTHSRGCLAH